jgi:hypothetical protein
MTDFELPTGQPTSHQPGELVQVNLRLPIIIHQVLEFAANGEGLSKPKLAEREITRFAMDNLDIARAGIERQQRQLSEDLAMLDRLQETPIIPE